MVPEAIEYCLGRFKDEDYVNFISLKRENVWKTISYLYNTYGIKSYDNSCWDGEEYIYVQEYILKSASTENITNFFEYIASKFMWEGGVYSKDIAEAIERCRADYDLILDIIKFGTIIKAIANISYEEYKSDHKKVRTLLDEITKIL